MRMNAVNEFFVFLLIQLLLDAENDDTSVLQILLVCEKYADRNAAAIMIAEVYYIRSHIALFKEVHTEANILT